MLLNSWFNFSEVEKRRWSIANLKNPSLKQVKYAGFPSVRSLKGKFILIITILICE